MRRLVFVASALTVLVGCQPATTELTEEQKAEIAAEVEAINSEFWDVWREADVTRGMSYYHDAPDFTLALSGQIVHGFSAFNELAATVFANVASQVITIDESETTVLARNVVLVVEHVTYTQTDTEGVTSPEYTAAITSIWVRHGDEWKVDHFHNSSPPQG